MAEYSKVVQALSDFRIEVAKLRQGAPLASAHAATLEAVAFGASRPNIHATGAGLRKTGVGYANEVVLKLYVFDKNRPVSPNEIAGNFQGVAVDVEELPIQKIRQETRISDDDFMKALAEFETPDVQEGPRSRFDAIPAGVSISPLGARFVGTLGCFVAAHNDPSGELFLLSNNHVLADVNALPIGTQIVQPGPELPSLQTDQANVFAELKQFTTIEFPGPDGVAPLNRFDAAIARVTDRARVRTQTMFGSINFKANEVKAPTPGIRVMKVGRTTGLTRGTVTATHVAPLRVEYEPGRVASFSNTLLIAGDEGEPFSLPGDSGSVILEEETGCPVALLFAGQGSTSSSAFELGAICEFFGAWPV